MVARSRLSTWHVVAPTCKISSRSNRGFRFEGKVIYCPLYTKASDHRSIEPSPPQYSFPSNRLNLAAEDAGQDIFKHGPAQARAGEKGSGVQCNLAPLRLAWPTSGLGKLPAAGRQGARRMWVAAGRPPKGGAPRWPPHEPGGLTYLWSYLGVPDGRFQKRSTRRWRPRHALLPQLPAAAQPAECQHPVQRSLVRLRHGQHRMQGQAQFCRVAAEAGSAALPSICM